jgi:DNA repair exonuclease SbcCD ATPase subunit
MNILEAIQLRDVGPFENVIFKIPKGISVIYGLNRAGGKASKNSNAVGKSVLTSQPAEILYDEPIVGERGDRIKHGTRALSYTNYSGHKVVIKRSMKGKSEKIAINVDGKDKKFRTSTIAKAYIKKSFPISAEEYNTYVHLDARVPHPLVMGSSTERKRFFTSFFGLDKMDTERRLFASELSKLSRTKAAFNELRATYNKSKEDLMSDELYASQRKKARAYKLQLKAYQEEFQTVQDTLRLMQYAESAKDQIATLQKALSGPITTELFEQHAKDNQWELDKVKTDLEEAEEWERYAKDLKAYNEEFDKLSNEAQALIEEVGLNQAREQTSAAAVQYGKARSQVERWLADIEEVEADAVQELPTKVRVPTEEIGDLNVLKNAYIHQLDHAEKFQEGKCETCGQIVKIKDPRVLKKRLQVVELKIDNYTKALEYKKAVVAKNKASFKLKTYRRDLERAKAKKQELSALAKMNRELQDLSRKPRKPKGKKLQIVVLKRMLEELYERKALLEHMDPHLETIMEFQKLTRADLKKAAASSGLSEKMNSTQERLSKISAQLEVHLTIKTRVLEMRERLVTMKRELKDEEPLRLLVQGYQDKNIKKMAVKAISQRLMALVNKYAISVFPESYVFEFEWGTQVSLIVHRKYGKKTLTSDVRKLSGAESKLFTIVLVLALLSFVPSHKRSSVMILDEPSANMSKEMTESFQALLPVLNTLIPSIIVVTPKSDEIYEDATTFTVVKSGGVATIVRGMPHQIK